MFRYRSDNRHHGKYLFFSMPNVSIKMKLMLTLGIEKNLCSAKYKFEKIYIFHKLLTSEENK